MPTLEPLNRKCVEALSRVYSEITWLRISSDTNSLLLKARESVGLPSGVTGQRSDSAPEVPLVARTSDLGAWANPIQPATLDQRFSHVYAFFFYPKSVSWEKGERDPRKLMPRLKAIVNYVNKEAFWMSEYALALFKEDKIQWVTAELDPYTEEEMRKYLKNRGIDLVEKPAYEVDLQQGTHVK